MILPCSISYDMEKGVAYIRAMVLENKSKRICVNRFFEEYLDCYFKKTWLRKKLVEMFNYNDGDNWKRDV